jgi:hypothetical protein
MPLPSAMFRGDASTGVEMPEPLSCVMQIKPLRPRLVAEHQHRAGVNLKGFSHNTDGKQTILADFDPVRQLDANVWLVKQLVTGWDGLRGDDGEPIPFGLDALQKISEDAECFALIYAEAENLGGKRAQVERGN